MTEFIRGNDRIKRMVAFEKLRQLNEESDKEHARVTHYEGKPCQYCTENGIVVTETILNREEFSDNIPTTEQVRDAARRGFAATRNYSSITPAEFDRFLDNIIQKARAEAWDEGALAAHPPSKGCDNCKKWLHYWNPYREN